jgi:carbamoyl-phosphate synthase large subunit
MAKRNVLVTATGGRSVGAGILHSLVRSSEEVASRWNVVAADAEPFSWGLYKVPQAVLLPPASSPTYLASVQKVIESHRIEAVIPGSEPEAAVLSNNRSRFSVPIITNSPELIPLMTDKFAATAKLRELGLPVIPTLPAEEWRAAVRSWKFPLVVKPTRGTGGSRGVSLCVSEQEVEQAVAALPADSGYCIQRLVGTEDDEYTVGVLSDKEGNLIDTIVMRRKLTGLSLLSSKTANGKNYGISTGYSQGYFLKDERVQRFCEALSQSIGSKGPLNIQLRVEDGAIYVFEIHPRFSGTSTMRADVGFNEADVLLRNHLFGESFGRLSFRTNVAAIRAFETVIVPLEEMLRHGDRA